MPKTKSVYDLTSRYRNQLLNRTVRNINNDLSSTDTDKTDGECNLESSLSCNEIAQSNLHDSSNHLEYEQDYLVASDLSRILNESSYNKYLELYDLCEKCSLCMCFLNCGECFHNEDYNCQHCTKCSTVDYDNDYETDNFYKEFDTYYEAESFRDKLAQWDKLA